MFDLKHLRVLKEVADRGSFSAALEALGAGEADIALLVESGFERESENERVERIHLLDDPMFLALPVDHPLASKRSVRLADLADETWMHDSSSCPDAAVFLRACH